MARKSKVSGISLECGNDNWRKEEKKYTEEVTFHRKGVPANHTYIMKRLDHNRVKKILDKADFHSMFFGVENILLQYHYEHKFYYKKGFRRLFNILSYGYWIFIWIYILYILYLKIIIGE